MAGKRGAGEGARGVSRRLGRGIKDLGDFKDFKDLRDLRAGWRGGEGGCKKKKGAREGEEMCGSGGCGFYQQYVENFAREKVRMEKKNLLTLQGKRQV